MKGYNYTDRSWSYLAKLFEKARNSEKTEVLEIGEVDLVRNRREKNSVTTGMQLGWFGFLQLQEKFG